MIHLAPPPGATELVPAVDHKTSRAQVGAQDIILTKAARIKYVQPVSINGVLRVLFLLSLHFAPVMFSASPHRSSPSDYPDVTRSLMSPGDSATLAKEDDSYAIHGKIIAPRHSGRRFWARFIGWPAAIILGQLVLQALGWGFFAIVNYHRQIALPVALSIWVKNNSHLVTLIATLISTFLAGCSSFLFSLAIRKSITLYLYRPMSLASLAASISISMRAVMFHRRNWKWPAISWFFFIATGIQTSGYEYSHTSFMCSEGPFFSWSTLITPVTIVVPTPLTGFDIDLSSPLIEQMATNRELDGCWVNEPWRLADVYSSFMVGFEESGYTAAKSSFGFPSTLTAMGQTFNMSTGGILAANLANVDASAWFPNGTSIPATIRSVSKSPPLGLATNYSMMQQGLTASVSCSLQNLSRDTNLSLDWEGGNTEWADGSTSSPIEFDRLFANCSSKPYSLILAANGSYAPMFGGSFVTCQLAPKTTKLIVDYTGIVNTTLDSIDASSLLDSALGTSVIIVLSRMIGDTQGVGSNVVGDHLLSISSQPNWNHSMSLQMVEKYFTGVVEFSGSVLRACLSTKGTVFEDGVPANMALPTHGIFYTETFGWTYASGTTLWALFPGAFVAISTILIVIAALYRHDGDQPSHRESFDPSNPLHLMAAASAGGLNNAFNGIGQKDMKKGEQLHVVLESLPGGAPALVRTDK